MTSEMLEFHDQRDVSQEQEMSQRDEHFARAQEILIEVVFIEKTSCESRGDERVPQEMSQRMSTLLEFRDQRDARVS